LRSRAAIGKLRRQTGVGRSIRHSRPAGKERKLRRLKESCRLRRYSARFFIQRIPEAVALGPLETTAQIDLLGSSSPIAGVRQLRQQLMPGKSGYECTYPGFGNRLDPPTETSCISI
jgi:hypothetical protein